ncbi:hypothetical protein [Sphingobacterium paludis]|uniref:TraB family protein n=1 Tax=Sphingobacterium paludis TaxID=1476465 RepID=A0A4V3E0T2_9SPHI|nr:hypothetical protein [Sphingobacterium paludis]TDS05960.1 hypothetical protein B0I21_1193 [Sphingobacterium paludis]
MSTKTFIALLIFSLVFNIGFGQKKSEIYIIGNIHDSVPNYNPQILFEIIDKIKPDIILHEVDSEGMKAYETSVENLKGNEIIASNRYVDKKPQTLRFPFDFEGRNQYRKERGMVPTDNLAVQLIDSLFRTHRLTTEETSIYESFQSITSELINIASLSPENFNNTRTDSIAEKRQYYQYHELFKIIKNRKEFSERHVVKPDGTKISYRDGFRLMSEFWDLRNKTMAENIYKISKRYPYKRIVVLTGFLHRYYLIKELHNLDSVNLNIRAFYE